MATRVRSGSLRAWGVTLYDLARCSLEAGYRGEKEILRRELPGGDLRCLDLGCGTGTLTGEFPAKGYLGVDIRPEFVARAALKRPDHRFARMDIRALGLASSSFELALISGVLHHLADADVEAVLAEVHRVLAPAGRLLLWEDVPTRSRWNLVGQLVHRFDEGDHIRCEPEYKSLLARFFALDRSYPMRSGVCDYAVFLCRKRSGA